MYGSPSVSSHSLYHGESGIGSDKNLLQSSLQKDVGSEAFLDVNKAYSMDNEDKKSKSHYDFGVIENEDSQLKELGGLADKLESRDTPEKKIDAKSFVEERPEDNSSIDSGLEDTMNRLSKRSF